MFTKEHLSQYHVEISDFQTGKGNKKKKKKSKDIHDN